MPYPIITKLNELSVFFLKPNCNFFDEIMSRQTLEIIYGGLSNLGMYKTLIQSLIPMFFSLIYFYNLNPKRREEILFYNPTM